MENQAACEEPPGQAQHEGDDGHLCGKKYQAVLIAEENLFTVEMALLVILETGWDVRKDEQINNSCFKMSVGPEMVTKLNNPMDQVERSNEFKLCDTVVSEDPQRDVQRALHEGAQVRAAGAGQAGALQTEL